MDQVYYRLVSLLMVFLFAFYVPFSSLSVDAFKVGMSTHFSTLLYY